MLNDQTQPRLSIKLIDQPTKSLGLWIGKDLTLSIKKNLEEKMKKMKSLINMNKLRNISIKGKVTLLRSIVMPHLLYVASVIPIPSDFIKEVDQLFFDFVWPNGKHHVKKNVLIQQIQDGGLNMPDVYSMLKALRLTWVKRLLNNESECTKIAQATSGIPSFAFLLEKKYDIDNVSSVTTFYRCILEEWVNVHTVEPTTVTEILNEILWLNSRIKIGDKTVFYKDWHMAGIDNLYDIVDTVNDRYLSLLELQDKFNIAIKTMEYNSLISSIPKIWKRRLNECNMNEIVRVNPLKVKLYNIYKNVSDVKCKDYYRHLIRRKKIPATAVAKWETMYDNVEFDWSDIYCCAFENTRETHLQSFQYKTLNRYIPCNVNLYRWKKSEMDLCSYCGLTDTIEHFLYKCNVTKSLWECFFDWLQSVLNIYVQCSILDIIFGITNPDKDCIIRILNFCIIFVKYFIYKSKINTKELSLNRLKQELRYRIMCEKCILIQQNKISEYYKIWHPILVVLL